MTVADDDLRDVLAALSYYAGRRLPDHLADLAELVDREPGRPIPGISTPVREMLGDGDRAAALLRLGRSLRERADAARIAMLIPGDIGWPQHGDLTAVPCLWVKGPADLTASLAGSVTITGTAAATDNGKMIAAEFGRGLAAARLTVVTGLTAGIDTAAAAAAFDCPATPPVLVAAAGLDQAAGVNLRRLGDRAAAQSAVISPFPPGCDRTAWRSTHRDTLLGTLAAATVLIEASINDSGTAAALSAAQSGRLVCAVGDPAASCSAATCPRPCRPGCAGDASPACHHLITQGAAAPVSGPSDVLEALRAAAARGNPAAVAAVQAASRPARSG